jgi:hypothetical protein
VTFHSALFNRVPLALPVPEAAHDQHWQSQWHTRVKNVFAALVIMLSASGTLLAQQQPANQQPITPPPAVQSNQDRIAAVILIKNTILAVNQGNLTGNYTVLRDLSSPGFRERNSAADLAAIFQNIRQQKIDLSPIVALEPMINPPQITADGQLILEGFFTAHTFRINFQLAFLKAGSGGWMIHGIALNTAPESAPVAQRAMPTAGTNR